MQNIYVHAEKMYNNHHKNDHIAGPTLPHTYNFAGPTSNKKKLPIGTRLVEEDRLWKLLLLAVWT
jgi:hypothetical protein